MTALSPRSPSSTATGFERPNGLSLFMAHTKATLQSHKANLGIVLGAPCQDQNEQFFCGWDSTGMALESPCTDTTCGDRPMRLFAQAQVHTVSGRAFDIVVTQDVRTAWMNDDGESTSSSCCSTKYATTQAPTCSAVDSFEEDFSFHLRTDPSSDNAGVLLGPFPHLASAEDVCFEMNMELIDGISSVHLFSASYDNSGEVVIEEEVVPIASIGPTLRVCSQRCSSYCSQYTTAAECNSDRHACGWCEDTCVSIHPPHTDPTANIVELQPGPRQECSTTFPAPDECSSIRSCSACARSDTGCGWCATAGGTGHCVPTTSTGFPRNPLSSVCPAADVFVTHTTPLSCADIPSQPPLSEEDMDSEEHILVRLSPSAASLPNADSLREAGWIFYDLHDFPHSFDVSNNELRIVEEISDGGDLEMLEETATRMGGIFFWNKPSRTNAWTNIAAEMSFRAGDLGGVIGLVCRFDGESAYVFEWASSRSIGDCGSTELRSRVLKRVAYVSVEEDVDGATVPITLEGSGQVLFQDSEEESSGYLESVPEALTTIRMEVYEDLGDANSSDTQTRIVVYIDGILWAHVTDSDLDRPAIGSVGPTVLHSTAIVSSTLRAAALVQAVDIDAEGSVRTSSTANFRVHVPAESTYTVLVLRADLGKPLPVGVVIGLSLESISATINAKQHSTLKRAAMYTLPQYQRRLHSFAITSSMVDAFDVFVSIDARAVQAELDDRSWQATLAPLLLSYEFIPFGIPHNFTASGMYLAKIAVPYATYTQLVVEATQHGDDAANPLIVMVRKAQPPDWANTQTNTNVLAGGGPVTITNPTPGAYYYMLVVHADDETFSGTLLADLLPRPAITSISTSSCSTSSCSVTVSGRGFGTSGHVEIDSQECPVAQYSEDAIVCSRGPGQGADLPVQVCAHDLVSNTAFFSYPAPVIEYYSPSLIRTETSEVIIVGSNFGTDVALQNVTIDGSPCSVHQDTESSSHSVIECTSAPAPGGTAALVTVTVAGQSVTLLNGPPKLGYLPPSIDRTEPWLLPMAAESYWIIGDNFGNSPASVVVTTMFADGSSTVLAQRWVAPMSGNHTHLRVPLFAEVSLSTTVTVEVQGQTAQATIAYAPPTVTDFDPSNGPSVGGFEFTVYGTNFGANNTVTPCEIFLGSQPCPLVSDPTAHTNTRRVCVMPPLETGEATVKITRSYADNAAFATDAFTVDVPQITSIDRTPASTEGGPLQVTGTSFGLNPTAQIIRVDPSGTIILDCARTDFNHTSLTCTAPPASGSGWFVRLLSGSRDVFVSEAITFDYPAPQVSLVAPAEIPPTGALVTITGSNFGDDLQAVTAWLNTEPITECEVTSNGFTAHVMFDCEVGAVHGRDLTLTVRVTDQEVTTSSAVNVTNPTISSVAISTAQPDRDPPLLVVSGSAFGVLSQPEVHIGDFAEPCVLESFINTEIICQAPPGYGHDLPVSVAVTGQDTATRPSAFSYPDPLIESLAIDEDVEVPDRINITGRYFGPTDSLRVRLTSCTVLLDPSDNVFLNFTLAPSRDDAWCSLSEAGVAAGVSLELARTTQAEVYARPALLPGEYYSVVVRFPVADTFSPSVTFDASYPGAGATALDWQYTVSQQAPELSASDTDPWTFGLPPQLVVQNGVQLRLSNSESEASALGRGLRANSSCSSALDAETAHSLAIDTLSFCRTLAPVDVDMNTVTRTDAPNGNTGVDTTELSIPVPAEVRSGTWVVYTQVANQDSAVEHSAAILGYRGEFELERVDGCPCTTATPSSVFIIGKDFSGDGLYRTDVLVQDVFGDWQPLSDVHVINSTTMSATMPALDSGGLGLTLVVYHAGFIVDLPAAVDFVTVTHVPATLRLASASDMGGAADLYAADSSSSITVRFNVTNAETTDGLAVYYGVPADTPLTVASLAYLGLSRVIDADAQSVLPAVLRGGFWRQCDGASIDLSLGVVQCTVPPSVGVDLRFAVRAGTRWSAPGTDKLHFPIPSISNATIRLNVEAALGADSVTLSSSFGGFITVDSPAALAVEPDLVDSLFVQIVPPDGTDRAKCDDLELYSNSSVSSPYSRASAIALRCRVLRASLVSPRRLGYAMRILVPGMQPADLTLGQVLHSNTFAFPLGAPEVLQVSGCEDDGVATFECPTAGGNRLTIVGVLFCNDGPCAEAFVSVRVGVNEALNVDVFNDTLVYADLPPGAGTGADAAVTVIHLGGWSQPAHLLEYGRVSVSRVSLGDGSPVGCSQPAGGTFLEGCSRSGGSSIAVHGANFGADGALVLVGGYEATSVAHDPDSPHTRLTCVLPPGKGLNLPVVVIPRKGSPSARRSSVSVSFESCGAGQFVALDAGSTRCEDCGVGKFSSVSEAASCTSCPGGRYSGSTGASSCRNCPAGRWSAQGASVCTSCQNGTVSDRGALSCTDCERGTYALLDGTECEPCPAGSFQREARTTSCDACVVGKYSRSGFTSCLDCPAGRFQELTSKSSCDACLPGTYSSQPGSKQCVSCSAGRVTSTLGQPSCDECPAGTWAANSTTCEPCGLGKTATPGQTHCRECDAGSYAASEGSTSCSVCPRGRYQPSRAKSACTKCPVGRYNTDESLAGHPVGTWCHVCELGKYSTGDAIECKSCAAGYWTPVTFESWLIVDSQGVKRYNSSTCQACPAGKYSANQGKSCLDCPVGRSSEAGAAVCDACDPGRYASEPGMASPCPQCERGQFSEGGGEPCLDCGAGFVAPVRGMSECEPCPAGYRQPQTGEQQCVACPIGFSSQSGQANCTACAEGKIASSPGQDSCQACSRGKYAPTTGLTACLDCVPGRYQPSQSGVGCLECIEGTASEASATQCSACPAGFFAPSGSRNCTACPAGTAQSQTGRGSCEACPIGRASAQTGQQACLACAPGRFSNSTGLLECYSCPDGYASSADSSDDNPSDSGTGDGSDTAAGGSDSGDTDSTSSGGGGISECTICAAGRFATAGQSSCSLCDEGKFSSTDGARECVRCTKGTHAPSRGSTACKECTLGSVAPSDGSDTCITCEAGTYAHREGMTSCLSCAAGTFQDAPGASECSSCDDGSQSEPGAMTCTPCGAGRYRPVNASSAVPCLECPDGTFQSGQRQTHCIPCGAGTESTESKTECTPCSDGQFSPRAGSACRVCTGGRQVNNERTACLCPVGTYLRAGTDSDCRTCPEGAECTQMGLVEERVPVRVGYWRAGNSSMVFYRCIGDDHCLGGLNAECGELRTGPLCAVCEDGSQQGVDDTCVPCKDNDRENLTAMIFICAGVVVGLGVVYFVVLFSDRELMRIVHREDKERSKRLRLAAKSKMGGGFDEHAEPEARTHRVASTYRPMGQPNLTYKLKIMISFVQITSSLVLDLRMPWPRGFRKVISVFSILNLEFVQWSSVGCVTKIDYYMRLVLVTAIPPLIMVMLALVYLLPYYVKRRGGLWCSYPDHYRRDALARKRRRRKTWKLVLLTMFLIFPHVSSVVLSMHVCERVEGVDYLVEDFSLRCYNDRWYRWLPLNLVALVAYPLGIPVIFALFLFRYRHRFNESAVRAEVGFLYDGYAKNTWWFELVDMAHKLILTSTLGFLPRNFQLPFGMGVAISYMNVILLRRPFHRKGDDRLIMFAQVEIFLLLLAGHVFLTTAPADLDSTDDVVMSVFLLIVVGVFCAVFIGQTLHIVRRLLRRLRNRKQEKEEKLHVQRLERKMKRQKTALLLNGPNGDDENEGSDSLDEWSSDDSWLEDPDEDASLEDVDDDGAQPGADQAPVRRRSTIYDDDADNFDEEAVHRRRRRAALKQARLAENRAKRHRKRQEREAKNAAEAALAQQKRHRMANTNPDAPGLRRVASNPVDHRRVQSNTEQLLKSQVEFHRRTRRASASSGVKLVRNPMHFASRSQLSHADGQSSASSASSSSDESTQPGMANKKRQWGSFGGEDANQVERGYSQDDVDEDSVEESVPQSRSTRALNSAQHSSSNASAMNGSASSHQLRPPVPTSSSDAHLEMSSLSEVNLHRTRAQTGEVGGSSSSSDDSDRYENGVTDDDLEEVC